MGGSTHDRVLRIEERLRERKQRRRRHVNAWLGIVCVLCICCVSWILCTEQTPGVSMVHGGYGTVLLRDGAGAYVVVGIAAFALGVSITLLCIRYRESHRHGEDPK